MVSLSGNIAFESLGVGEDGGSSWAFIDIGLGARLNSAVEKDYSRSMKKHSMTLFGVDEPKAQSKTYKLQLSNEQDQSSIQVDEESSSLLFEVYRKINPDKVNAKTPGYFLLSYTKLEKAQVDSLGSGDEEAVLSKEFPMESGDLVLVTANVGWKHEGSETACRGAVVEYSLVADGKTVGSKTRVQMGDYNLDESTLKFYKHEVEGKTKFDLKMSVDGGESDCNITVAGYSSLYFRIFRPLRKLNTDGNRDKAYYLFEQSYSNEGAGGVRTVEEGELQILPVFTKKVKLLKEEVIVYDVMARAKSQNAAPSRVLIQLEHEKRKEHSPVARAGMGAKFSKSILYLSNGIYTEDNIIERVTLKAGGYHDSGKPIKMDDIHFRYQIYSKLK